MSVDLGASLGRLVIAKGPAPYEPCIVIMVPVIDWGNDIDKQMSLWVRTRTTAESGY